MSPEVIRRVATIAGRSLAGDDMAERLAVFVEGHGPEGSPERGRTGTFAVIVLAERSPAAAARSEFPLVPEAGARPVTVLEAARLRRRRVPASRVTPAEGIP